MGNWLFAGFRSQNSYTYASKVTGFWLGPARAGFDMHFPSCSDELIDWTDEATQILRLFLQKGVSRRLSGGRYEPQQQNAKSYQGVSIQPKILASSEDVCRQLASLEVIERIRFFANDVSWLWPWRYVF